MFETALIKDLIVGAWTLYKTDQSAAHARSVSLRLLEREVLHNLSVLDSLHLDPGGKPPSNHPSFLLAAQALRTDAHSAALTAADLPEEDTGNIIERQHEQQVRVEALSSLKVTVLADGIEQKKAVVNADPDLKNALARIRAQKHIGLLEAVLVAGSRISALQALSSMPQGAVSARRNIRGKMRLQTIRAYEQAIVTTLGELEATPRIRSE